MSNDTKARYASSPIPMYGTTDDEYTSVQVENRWNGESWLVVRDGYSLGDTNKPANQTIHVRMTAGQRDSLIQALQRARDES